MNPEPPHANSLTGLLRELRDESSTLLRQEVRLAKLEMKENVSRASGHVTQIAIGGFVAYAGVIVLLIGIGHLLGALLIRAGLDPQVAEWLAPAVVGLVVALIGWAMLSRARHAIAHDEIIPDQTVESLKDNKEWAQEKLKTS
jgi:xanthine/uracil permease